MLPLRHDIGRVTFIVLHDFIFVRGRKYHKKIVDVNVSLLLKQKRQHRQMPTLALFMKYLLYNL